MNYTVFFNMHKAVFFGYFKDIFLKTLVVTTKAVIMCNASADA